MDAMRGNGEGRPEKSEPGGRGGREGVRGKEEVPGRATPGRKGWQKGGRSGRREEGVTERRVKRERRKEKMMEKKKERKEEEGEGERTVTSPNLISHHRIHRNCC